MAGSDFANTLVGDWYRPHKTALTLALTPLSWLFGAIASSRRALYRAGLLRSTWLPVPVIIVGNIAVGGAGKTPLTIALVAALRARGYRVGIVSRGYGGKASMARAVVPGSHPDDVGDEPLLLVHTGAPVWVGADRVAAAQSLLAAHRDIDVIVSDDGLQHNALGRDCEIVVVDGQRGFGNGALLPAGPLRESIARLSSVDAIVINGGAAAADVAASLSRIVPAASTSAPTLGPTLAPSFAPTFAMVLDGDRFVNLVDGATELPDAFVGKRVHAIAGIGNPDRFFATLRALGLDPTCHPFPDHHRFVARDLDVAASGDVILMTGKDAIKCQAFADARMWALPVTARFDAVLVDRIVDRIADRVMERRHGSETARNPGVPGNQGPARL